jgi:starch synthase
MISGQKHIVSNEINRKLWMLSFESSDVAQVGGLGPAVANLSRALATELEVTVVMPSHGKHEDPKVKEKLDLHEIAGSRIRGARKGVDGNLYPYDIGLESGSFRGVRYVLAKGLDDQTRGWLDNPQIYDGEVTYQKMALFARAVEGHLDYIINNRQEQTPNVIHAHDWHVVPAAVSARQRLSYGRTSVPLVYTVHLLSGKGLPWHYISEDWCGVKDERHYVDTGEGWRFLEYKEVWDNLSSGRFETFGGYEADFITSVSKTYLESDVFPLIGSNFRSKSGFIYNGCDWDEDDMVRAVMMDHQHNPDLATPIGRSELRRYLLTKALGGMTSPRVIEPGITEVIERGNLQLNATRKDLVRSFQEDGELVLMTGRLDKQKGVDVLLRAIPEVLDALPSTKFLLLLIPISQTDLIISTMQAEARYEKNMRLIFGRATDIYGLAHVSADVYAMPSRWEPFGISALEAMATGNPVVGTHVGGINETVLDVEEYSEDGTGHLVGVDDFRELARGIVSFLIMMNLTEGVNKEPVESKSKLIDKIPYDRVRELVERNSSIGLKIRENCRARVKTTFNLRNSAKMAINAYDRAFELAAERIRKTDHRDSR